MAPPLIACIEGDRDRVAWMPAHCSEGAVGVRLLSNGEFLTSTDLCLNELAVRAAYDRTTAVATWIVHCTARANDFPDGVCPNSGKHRCLRDSEGMSVTRRREVARMRAADTSRLALAPAEGAGR